jgi:hypothetical protein
MNILKRIFCKNKRKEPESKLVRCRRLRYPTIAMEKRLEEK